MDKKTETKLKEFLQTKEGREYIVQYMKSPFRCPGLDYFEGKPVYYLNGYLIPEELISGKDAREVQVIIDEWAKTNSKYKIGSFIKEDGKKYRTWALDQ